MGEGVSFFIWQHFCLQLHASFYICLQLSHCPIFKTWLLKKHLALCHREENKGKWDEYYRSIGWAGYDNMENYTIHH